MFCILSWGEKAILMFILWFSVSPSPIWFDGKGGVIISFSDCHIVTEKKSAVEISKNINLNLVCLYQIMKKTCIWIHFCVFMVLQNYYLSTYNHYYYCCCWYFHSKNVTVKRKCNNCFVLLRKIVYFADSLYLNY